MSFRNIKKSCQPQNFAQECIFMFYSWKEIIDTLSSVFVCVFAVPSLSACMLSLHTVSPKYVSSMLLHCLRITFLTTNTLSAIQL